MKYSVNSLVDHLGRHPVYKEKYEASLKEPQTPKITSFVTTPIGLLASLKSRPGASMHISRSLSTPDRRVMHFIAATHVPFNVVNHDTFRALFGATNRSGVEAVKGEGDKHYREIVLPRVYKYAMVQIRRHLPQQRDQLARTLR